MKIAIVLFNLGGPDNLQNVKPFLFNLFNDKNIIALPKPVGFIIAKLISWRREKTAREIYGHIGGKSPIVEQTEKQAEALKNELHKQGIEADIYISMRYWHPRAEEVINKIAEKNYQKVLLLPLYPQFSTTTTLSSVEEFISIFKQKNLKSDIKICGCYPTNKDFIKAHTELMLSKLEGIEDKSSIEIFFSAHGLPQKIIDKGDPYQYQVEQTKEEIVKLANISNLSYKITYQSRVGPVKWLEPNTEDEVIRAAKEGKNIVILPIAFVSEHSETLYELDYEYKKLALENGAKGFFRIKALQDNENFIKSLAYIAKDMLHQQELIKQDNSYLGCPKDFSKCFCLNYKI